MIRKSLIFKGMETIRETVIKASELSFNYGRGPLLQGLNFSVRSGDFVGLIGGNGSGKSTLLRLLLGRVQPLTGAIELFACPLNRFRDWDKIAYIPQKASRFNHDFPINVSEVLALPLKDALFFSRRRRLEEKALIGAALAQVGLEAFAQNRMGELSGGQQQRVFIAKALVTQASLLILDEPTVGVDQASEREIYELLARLNREQGLTILWVSHDIAAVSAYTNRLLCLGPEGFFEHFYGEDAEETSLERLYGYAVRPHRHCVDCGLPRGEGGSLGV